MNDFIDEPESGGKEKAKRVCFRFWKIKTECVVEQIGEQAIFHQVKPLGWELTLISQEIEIDVREAGKKKQSDGAEPLAVANHIDGETGGEQQKVNLARALISPRRLLLLDEPTASLDAQTRAALVERLGQLKERGIAMIGVFHQPEEVMSLVDKKVHLEPTNGKVRANEKELAYVAE